MAANLPARPSRRRFRQRTEWEHPATRLSRTADPRARQGMANSWWLLEAAHCDNQAEVDQSAARVTAVLIEEAARLSQLMEK
jgi:hypothetical protein